MMSSPSGSRLRSLRCLSKSLVGRVRENPQSNKYYKYKDKKFQCLQVCHCPADTESFEWKGNEKTPVSDKEASPIRDQIFWKSNKGHWYCIGCIWSEDSRSQSVCAGRWQSSVCGWYGVASRDRRVLEMSCNELQASIKRGETNVGFHLQKESWYWYFRNTTR